MSDPKRLGSTWDEFSRQGQVHNIYLETHRDLLIVDEKILEGAIAFFKAQGIAVGGIAYLTNDSRENVYVAKINHLQQGGDGESGHGGRFQGRPPG